MTLKRVLLLLYIFAGTFVRKYGVACNLAVHPRNGLLGTSVTGSTKPLTSVTVDDRPTCAEGESTPPSRVDTTERVIKLRAEMTTSTVDAYIIPSGDAHQSEYVAEADERRQYITGFSGSAGTAVVTSDHQALWTDGRYFLQAENELDCHWMLMKELEEGVPTILEWLLTLPSGSRVAADPTLMSAQTWLSYAESLQASNIEMVNLAANLVDSVWTGRPEYTQDEVFVHPIEYAGKSWQDKVAEVREIMTTEGADMLILTALDEVAWLLNLRGSDIPYNPVFRSYVTITPTEVNLFVPSNKITAEVRQHLTSGDEAVNVQDYGDIWLHLTSSAPLKAMIPGPYSYAGGASYAGYSAIRQEARTMVTSPVLLKKAQKNKVEIQGMKNAHVRDAVALCDFLSFLEKEITSGNSWTEISATDELANYRAQQEGAKGQSFSPISGFGPNGAVIHYEASAVTDVNITTSSLYLLDSGGQYLDGTTDVTRTMHYGQPTDFMVETYTRVLMGHVNLASAVFPKDTGDTRLDILARRPLYEVGLDYKHGTGHGIGMFLGVHEAPTQVRIYGTEDHPFQLGYFFSDEPGFYRDYEFGIRLESIMTVVEKNTTYGTQPMLGFEAVTLVPFEAKLIDTTLLDEKQCNWLNAYHAQILDVVGEELVKQKRSEAYDWLKTKTEPLCIVSASVIITSSLMTLMVGLCISLLH